MKVLLASVSVLFFSIAPALAGDGSLPEKSLARMGLGGMKSLSDREGMSIRGQVAFAYSYSSVTGGTTYTIVNKPVGQHFAISVTVAVGSGLFAAGGASATSH